MTAGGAPGLHPHLALSCEGRHVLGFPLHAGLTARPSESGVALYTLPLVTPFMSPGALGLTLIADDGTQIVKIDPAITSLPIDHEPRCVLEGDDGRRMLADLSELLPRALPPGSYEMLVRFGSREQWAESDPQQLLVREPNDDEARALAAIAPELLRCGSLGQWCYLHPATGERLAPPAGPDDPLRFNRLMRYLFYGSQPLSHADVKAVGLLGGGVYAPEAAAIEMELYKLIGDDSAYVTSAAALRRDHPAMSWWIDDIEAGASIIDWERQHPP